ncbi:MAG: helix-turn-helix domain-containing protein [Candidatus Methanomethyliaceae archaeon]|nr:helix-turn-helix domain-containing protein [Candidatus Methanomethyliaceae archaeon]
MESNEAFVNELKNCMRQMGITTKELSEGSGLPLSTINKIISQERDLRLSTLRNILKYLRSLGAPEGDITIGIIAARPSLDKISKHQIITKGKKIIIKEYPASSIEDVIITAIKAEREKVDGIVCASIVAQIIEKFVRVPIMAVIVEESNLLDSVFLLVNKILSKA